MSIKLRTYRFRLLGYITVAIIGMLLEVLPIQSLRNYRFRTLNRDLRLSNAVNTRSSRSRLSSRSWVLMDSFPVPHWGLINSIAGRDLASATDSELATFSFSARNFTEKSLYSSLGVENHLRIHYKFHTFLTGLAIYSRLTRRIISGAKVIDLQLGEVNIGLDVYESFLRRGHPTLDLMSRDLYRELWRGVKQYVYFKPLFTRHTITAVLVSHDNYVGSGLLSRMAYQFEVPVFLINPFEINIVSRPFHLNERFQRYREYFLAQTNEWKEVRVEQARDELTRRINGEIGVGKMNYQIKSAFTHHTVKRQINPTSNKKILILSHDFFDNPHGISRMLFDDFIDWLTFVSDCCRIENIDCYIKLHRDFSELELGVVIKFQQDHPHVLIVDSETSYHQLYLEGIRFVTTCYGSAAHELPLLGFTVINSSYNPHIAFSFSHHAKSKDHYKKLLVEQPKIVIGRDLENEIYMFYSVHSFLMWPDSFNFNSFEEFLSESGADFFSKDCLQYLDNHFDEIVSNVSANLQAALATRRNFSVERFLDLEMQQHFSTQASSDSLFNRFV